MNTPIKFLASLLGTNKSLGLHQNDYKKPKEATRNLQCIYSGSKMSSSVEVIGTCSLVLNSNFILELEKTFYVPSVSRNLISISRLVPLGFSFNFLDYGFSLSNKYKVIGYGTLFDGLFYIQIQNYVTYNSMHKLLLD